MMRDVLIRKDIWNKVMKDVTGVHTRSSISALVDLANGISAGNLVMKTSGAHDKIFSRGNTEQARGRFSNYGIFRDLNAGYF